MLEFLRRRRGVEGVESARNRFEEGEGGEEKVPLGTVAREHRGEDEGVERDEERSGQDAAQIPREGSRQHGVFDAGEAREEGIREQAREGMPRAQPEQQIRQR